MLQPRTGARILVDQLQIQGVNHLFCVPGESYLAVLDALLDAPGIRVIVNRHESGAAFMADAYARLTGQPGVVCVTRGPGASNAAIAIHTAFQDSTPLVVFVGQVGSEFVEREAFQEIDYRRMFGVMTKWTAQVDRADRLPELVARAFQVATSGRPGPVVLALPEDMLATTASTVDALCHQPVMAAPSDTQLAALRRLLGHAQRPLVLLGGAGWSAVASDNLRRWAHANQLPVACAFRCQDLCDNRDPVYVGDVGIGINPRLAQRVKDADLLIALGARLGEATTGGYTLLEAPRPHQTLVHVHGGIEELGRVYQAQLMINSGMAQFAARLAMMMPIEDPPWAAELVAARADYDAWQRRPAVYARHDRLGDQRSADDDQRSTDDDHRSTGDPAPVPKLDLWQVIRELRAELPDDAILANGAGNFATWGHRFFSYHGWRTQLAPTAGSMGYGVPAAIGAKIVAPERTVACLTGDGDFLMTGQELATAVQYRAGIVVLLFDNGMYGTIRMHQERQFPGRVSATGLLNPDFVQLARAYGASGARVERTAEFRPALRDALQFIRANRLPALIVLACDPQVITPNATLDEIAARAG